MIIVKLWGGLGNQMFQYAAAKALAVKNCVELKLDTSHFMKQLSGETPRQYKLDVFPKIREEIATKDEIQRIVPDFTIPLGNTVFKKINRHLFHFNKRYQFERASSVREIQLNSLSSAYLDGYWQSEKYFEQYEQIIRQHFSLDHIAHLAPLLNFSEQIRNENSVSIHIRRGDYISNRATSSFHGLLQLDFYHSAIAEMIDRWGDDLSFFIFSDDIEWCIEHLKIQHKHTYVRTNEDYYDLYLMSICKHQIIANSSFSWWGAWLNANPGKHVIAPVKWFSRRDSRDIIPLSWTTK